MRKILSGVMGIAMTGAVVTASAFALWTAQATVSGINFNTGSLSLTLSVDGVNDAANIPTNLTINDAFPGWEETATFYVHNGEDTPMDVSMQLTSANGWNSSDLKNYVMLAIVDNHTITDDTGVEYKTLAEWNADSLPILEDSVGVNQVRVFAKLSEDAPNSVQNKSLTDITFTFTGESVAQVD